MAKQPPSIPVDKSIFSVLNWVFLAFALACIVYLCSFKIMDRDFWWHVKAGDVMLQTHSMISVDPFAYTRQGLPYISRYEWLSQIFLSGVYHLGGTTWILLFRTVLIVLAFGWLLWIDRSRFFPNSLLVVYAATAAMPGFMDRPQLFTFLILAAFLYLAIQWLEGGNEKRIWAWLMILQVLWTNMHGAACIVGLGIVGAAACDQWLSGRLRDRQSHIGLALLVAATFITPDPLHNFHFFSNLMTDKTIEFINEWKARPWPIYLNNVGLLWVLGAVSIGMIRRRLFFSSVVFLSIGILSRTAFRHEMLFAIVSAGLIIYQLKYSPVWNSFIARLPQRTGLFFLFVFILPIPVWSHVYHAHQYFCQRDHLFGYGVFAPAQGAYDFVERENLSGNMFNTYGIGGYLLFRGYPTRKVYIDGRNVDYGYDFMMRSYQAGFDPTVWKSVEDEYDITYAIIDYDAIQTKDQLPYTFHLDANPNWALVYVDDWTAVYVKDVPANRDIIKRNRYLTVKPSVMRTMEWVFSLPPLDFPGVLKELQRSVEQNPLGVRARILLAYVGIRLNMMAQANQWIDEAQAIEPYRPEVYQARASIAMRAQDWATAADSYDRAIRLAGPAFQNINYGFVGDVYQKAGDLKNARRYWKKAGRL